MQTVQTVNGSTKPSTLTVLRMAVKESGLRSIYVGISASIMRQMSYSLVRLGAYERMKHSIVSDTGASGQRTGRLLVAAGLAGGLGGIAGNPAGVSAPVRTGPTEDPDSSGLFARRQISCSSV
jgi:solute carrier family 25 (mitochondrial dicarboxylate transporter), member 10